VLQEAFMKRGFVFMLVGAICVACLGVAVWIGVHAQSSDRAEDKPLDEEERTHVSKLLRQFEEATAEEVKWAEYYLKLGHRAIARGQWGAAAKAFGIATQDRPTPRTMLDLAFSYAHLNGSGYPCEEAIDIKYAVFRRALDYFEAGLEMHKILGSRSDLDEAAIVGFHKKMLDAQKRLLDFQRKCFGPDKTERGRQ